MLYMLQELSDRDITKHETILKLPVAHVLLHANYLLDYKEVHTPKNIL